MYTMENVIGYCFQSLGGTFNHSVGYVTVICPHTKKAKMYSGLGRCDSINADVAMIAKFGGSVCPEVAAAYWKNSCKTELFYEKYRDLLEKIEFTS